MKNLLLLVFILIGILEANAQDNFYVGEEWKGYNKPTSPNPTLLACGATNDSGKSLIVYTRSSAPGTHYFKVFNNSEGNLGIGSTLGSVGEKVGLEASSYHGLSQDFLTKYVMTNSTAGKEEIILYKISASDASFESHVAFASSYDIKRSAMAVGGNRKAVVAWTQSFVSGTYIIGIQLLQNFSNKGSVIVQTGIHEFSKVDIAVEDNGDFVILYREASNTNYTLQQGNFAAESLGLKTTVSITDPTKVVVDSDGDALVFNENGDYQRFSKLSLTSLGSGDLRQEAAIRAISTTLGATVSYEIQADMDRNGDILTAHKLSDTNGAAYRLGFYDSNLELKSLNRGAQLFRPHNFDLAPNGQFGILGPDALLANDYPINMSLGDDNIDENNSLNVTVSSISTTDPDSEDSHSYQLVEGTGDTDNASFFIDGNRLRAAESFDYEGKNSYSIRLRTDDGKGGYFEKSFTITINDIVENSAPSDISLSSNTIEENGADNAVIGDLSTEDVNSGDLHTYSLVADFGDNDAFDIDNINDRLLAKSSFDFETKSSYNIKIRSTDNTNLFVEKEFIISVTDQDESVPVALVLSPANRSIIASAPREYAIRFNEAVTQGKNYSISLFTQDSRLGDPTLVAEAVGIRKDGFIHFIDFGELNLAAGRMYWIAISATSFRDADNNYFAGTSRSSWSFEINSGPSDMDLSNSSIMEGNSKGDFIGSLTTIDLNGANDFHTYELFDATSFPDNNAFVIKDDQLLAAQVFDASVQSKYEINIQTTDQYGAQYTEAFQISIDFSNNTPTGISLSDKTIEENQNKGTVIGALTTADADQKDVHTYKLVDGKEPNDNLSFIIKDGSLLSAEVFNFATKSSYTIRVQTDDGNGGTFEQNFTIDVIGKSNSVPSAISLTESTIEEGNAVGDLIGSFTTKDEDVLDEHTYALVDGKEPNDNASFIIKEEFLLAGETFDFENKNSYSITVQSDDGKGGTITQTFGITINDVQENTNNAPTAISLSASSMDEGNKVEDVIGSFGSKDPDESDSHTYRLFDLKGVTDNGSFIIKEGQLLAGEEFDFESKSSYVIRVQTDDGNGGTFEDTFTISINDVAESSNEVPTAISLGASSIDESNAIGDVIGTFTTADPDAADTHTYELVAGTGDADNGSFTITDGKLEAGDVFDFETKSSYSIRVQTNDDNGGTFESAFTISITDVEEKQEQTITIEPIEDVFATAADFEITATTSSGLALSYAVLSGPATIAGSTVSLTGETGTVEIEVSQAGNEDFQPATASTSFEVIEDPCQGFEAAATVLQNVSCNAGADGSFEVMITAGTAPFTYSLNETTQESALFENLSAGTYEVSVTDANGCSATASVEITAPEALTATAETTDSNSIFGNGSISLTATGGTGAYTYSWSNGATTATLSDLGTGEYTVSITDEAGCSLTESYTIGGVTSNTEAFEIRMYPNPVVNQLKIRHAEGVEQISLLDATGKIIQQEQAMDSQSTVDMKSLPAGLYFIRLDDGQMKRIIKQ